MVGPPGSKRKEIALGLTAHFSEEGKDFQCISVGDLITRQITQKNQQFGEHIEQSLKDYSYVRDEIVIKLVKQQIEHMEQHQKSWIIEGFPRTEAQAIALQKMGVIPDKFILLNQDDQTTLDAVMQNLSGEGEAKSGVVRIDDLRQRQRIAQNAVLEYNLQIGGVQNICRGFITELESNRSEMRVVEEINRILKLKNTNAPRRPQRIILMGSPGARKEEFALRIAEKYQVVYVQVQQLIREVTRRNDDNDYARQLKSYIAQDRIGKSSLNQKSKLESNLLCFLLQCRMRS